MASLGAQEVSELRRQVTSPKGTTERAIEVLQTGQLSELLIDALLKAKQRCEELQQDAAGNSTS